MGWLDIFFGNPSSKFTHVEPRDRVLLWHLFRLVLPPLRLAITSRRKALTDALAPIHRQIEAARAAGLLNAYFDDRSRVENFGSKHRRLAALVLLDQAVSHLMRIPLEPGARDGPWKEEWSETGMGGSFCKGLYAGFAILSNSCARSCTATTAGALRSSRFQAALSQTWTVCLLRAFQAA